MVTLSVQANMPKCASDAYEFIYFISGGSGGYFLSVVCVSFYLSSSPLSLYPSFTFRLVLSRCMHGLLIFINSPRQLHQPFLLFILMEIILLVVVVENTFRYNWIHFV